MGIITPVACANGGNGAIGTGIGSATTTTTANILANDLVVIGVWLNSNNGVSASSVSDGTNSYTKIVSTGVISAVSEATIWYKTGASAVSSGATITVTFNTTTTGSNSGCGILAARVPINAFPLALDANGQNSSAGATSVTATTGTLAQTDEIAFGFVGQLGSNVYTVASGFTNLTSTVVANGNGTCELDYQMLSSLSAVSYAPSFNASARIGDVAATFKLPPFLRRRSIVNYVDKRIGFSI